MAKIKQPEVVNPIAPVIDPATEVVVRPIRDLFGGNRIITSLPTGTEGERMRVVNLVNGAAGKLMDHAGKFIEVSDIISHDVQWMDANSGELIETTRILLICADGAVVSTCSKSMKDGLARVAAVKGLPPWRPPVILVAQLGRSSSGRMIYHVGIHAEKE